MKAFKTVVAMVIISLATVSVAQAAGVNKREAAQRHSIRAGVEDGSLTGREAKRLRNQQVKLEAKEQRFRADGELSPGERARLQHSLDHNRARIYSQRHDEQVQTQE
ncbi:MAG: hypothetical protein ABJ308_15440 [Halieaceae bacterium]